MRRSVVYGVAFGLALGSACSSTEVDPLPALPEAPEYLKVTHPNGMDMSDVRALFFTPGAPERDTLKNCDSDFLKLQQATNSLDEIREGVREMVVTQPVRYHWCFYTKLLDLEAALKAEGYYSEKQKHVLDAYLFLTPVSRAFHSEYRDPRYLRWATHYYQQLSEWVFYRRVVPGPEANERMLYTGTQNSYGLVRNPDLTERKPVLEKYGLSKPDLKSEVPTVENTPAELQAAPSEEVSAVKEAPSEIPLEEPVSVERTPAQATPEALPSAEIEEMPLNEFE